MRDAGYDMNMDGYGLRRMDDTGMYTDTASA